MGDSTLLTICISPIIVGSTLEVTISPVTILSLPKQEVQIFLAQHLLHFVQEPGDTPLWVCTGRPVVKIHVGIEQSAGNEILLLA